MRRFLGLVFAVALSGQAQAQLADPHSVPVGGSPQAQRDLFHRKLAEHREYQQELYRQMLEKQDAERVQASHEAEKQEQARFDEQKTLERQQAARDAARHEAERQAAAKHH